MQPHAKNCVLWLERQVSISHRPHNSLRSEPVCHDEGDFQPGVETSAAYESAAAPLRKAPEKNYDFNRASVRDVLRFLADDAEIDFVALPEDGDDNTKLITFSLNKSPFSALETISRMNGVALVFEDNVWHMRPFNDSALIARAYRVRFNTAELKGSGNQAPAAVH